MGAKMWRDSMPPGVPVFPGTAVEDLSRGGRKAFVIRIAEDGALVLADDGAQWGAELADVRIDLDQRSGVAAALCALGPHGETDTDDWNSILSGWSADDIEDADRVIIADACADVISADVRRAEESAARVAEDKARREKNIEEYDAIGDKLFGGGADYDWTIESSPEHVPGTREIKQAVDDIECAGCIDAREQAKENPATCDTCGASWA